jgi:thymidine kinase
MVVWLIKPAVDNRDGANLVKSRIGLTAVADVIEKSDDLLSLFRKRVEQGLKTDVIIADECQFFQPGQIDSMRYIVDTYDIPVLCFGLRTDFLTHLFPGSLRLFELSDSITEIKTICSCGVKASVNARIDKDGNTVTEGEQIFLGGNDSYLAMCFKCWEKSKRKNKTT